MKFFFNEFKTFLDKGTNLLCAFDHVYAIVVCVLSYPGLNLISAVFFGSCVKLKQSIGDRLIEKRIVLV